MALMVVGAVIKVKETQLACYVSGFIPNQVNQA